MQKERKAGSCIKSNIKAVKSCSLTTKSKSREKAIPYDELQKVLQDRLNEIADDGKRQIVVPVDQVKNYLPHGYDFQANLGNGEAVLKLYV